MKLVLVLALVLAASACSTQGLPPAHEGEAQEPQPLDLPRPLDLPPLPPGPPGSESVSYSPYFRVRSKLVEALRGSVDATLDIAILNCGGARYDFELGENYLIFAESLTFGGKLKVIAPMGHQQGVFRLSEDGQAAGIRGTVDINELRDRVSP